jgi:hypothetical protein
LTQETQVELAVFAVIVKKAIERTKKNFVVKYATMKIMLIITLLKT